MQQKRNWLLQGEDCMKSFCKDLRDHAMKITNYEEKRNGTAN